MAYCTYQEVKSYNFQTNFVFLSLKINIVLANSEDPDEMPHLGIH